MKLSRKWLNEFVDLPQNEINDRAFAEAMTVSGSKVEITEDLSASMRNIRVGRVVSIRRHPDSDHMFILLVDVGEKQIQIVTGAWNVHAGDLVPVACDNSLLPNGKEIHSGMLRGELSEGMLCSLKELNLTEHDYPYAAIHPAAILGDYHPIDPKKPSISPDIQTGDKIFGSVIAAEVKAVASEEGAWRVTLNPEAEVICSWDNIHEGDLIAYDTSKETILGLDDLHAKQAEFPHCQSDGIFILHEEVKPGDDIAAIIGYDDHVVEFEITPNRPDCLCMIGLAREAAVTFDRPLTLHTPQVKAEAGGDVNTLTKITIEDPELCRRYTARMVRNVKIRPSPAWMRERIRNAGMRPINNLVDITNYVMLEYGQPMHAFDFSCVKGGEIHVRTAKEGESIRTLDGTERALTTQMLCICDTEKPVGVAGVMGGENSEIVGDTAMVLFESANFDGVSIRRTATALGMRTDASSRFEKGLDTENTYAAVQRACELVELLGAGEVIEGTIDVYPGRKAPVKLSLEPEKINALLGTDIPAADMEAILRKLGFGAENGVVTVPSWRGDVEHYSDLAEEVARFYGYNEIPTAFTGAISTCGGYSPEQQCERRIGELCRGLGMNEIITYSFISPAYYDRIRLPADSPLRDSLKILNPLGEDTSIMRTTILPSMLEILSRNYNFRNKSAMLYEIGRTYHKRDDGLADEPKTLSIGAYGDGVDFFVLKGWIECILNDLDIHDLRFCADRTNPSYHPGRCAEVWAGGQRIGNFGQIHPRVMQNYGVDTEFYCAELSFNAIFALQGGTPVFTPLPRFPAVTRDIAVICDISLPAGKLVETVRQSGGERLRDCVIFDVYTGHHIVEGKKSVAMSLTMRADDQTLTDEDANTIMRNVLSALKEEHAAEIRM